MKVLFYFTAVKGECGMRKQRQLLAGENLSPNIQSCFCQQEKVSSTSRESDIAVHASGRKQADGL